jgi:AraC-like DNA-binding protein/mannose-6-phosphate isomerase-like protein (cupin superfamily)
LADSAFLVIIYAKSDTARQMKSTNLEDYQSIPRPVGAMAKSHANGQVTPMHRHPRAQLLYAVSGVMEITTSEGLWVVPLQRAVWIPPLVDHELRVRGETALRTLYVHPKACPSHFPERPRLVSVSPLLRELVVRATELPVEYDESGHDGRVIKLIFDEINFSTELPFPLFRPVDPRLLRIHTALMSHPADRRTLEDWARTVGLSSRTLTRLLLAETGVSFLQWRAQLRLLTALPRLAAGEAVTNIALDLGYDTPSAFSAMFRRFTGKIPSHYFR